MFKKKISRDKHLFVPKNVSSENRAFCEIRWKKHGVAGQASDDRTRRRGESACYLHVVQIRQ